MLRHLGDSLWDDYRDSVSPYGIRHIVPAFVLAEGKVLCTFAILYREVRSPGAADLQLIEEPAHVTSRLSAT